MWKSFKVFLCAILRRWWAMVIGVLAVIGIITNITDGIAAPWLWIWIGVSALVLFVATFLAFHRIREELDKLKDTLPSVTVTSDPEGS